MFISQHLRDLSQTNSTATTTDDSNVPMSLGVLLLITLVIPIIYFIIGGVVLTAWLGDPVQWPLFMKKAVAGTGVFNTSPDGGRTWPGHSQREREIVEESNRRFQHIDAEMAAGPSRGDPDPEWFRSVMEPGMMRARTEEPTDISRTRRRFGSFVIFFTGFLVWFLWPLPVVYGIVWWFVYGIWAWHYIYLSTRRSRVMAQIHARDGDQQHPTNGTNTVAVTVTREVSARIAHPNRGNETYRATVTAGRGTVTSGGEFYRFYPQVGKLSRKVKTILEYESAMPTPTWNKAAMLHADRKRRDKLDGRLYKQSPPERVDIQYSHERLGPSPDQNNTVIQTSIPIRQRSTQQNGRRLKRQSRQDSWPQRNDGDIKLRTLSSSRMKTTPDRVGEATGSSSAVKSSDKVGGIAVSLSRMETSSKVGDTAVSSSRMNTSDKAGKTTVTLSSVPERRASDKVEETTIASSSVSERRASAQRAGARNSKRNAIYGRPNGAGASSENEPLTAPHHPPALDAVSSTRDVRRLYTIEEGDHAEEEEHLADENLNSREPHYVWSPVPNDAPIQWRRLGR